MKGRQAFFLIIIISLCFSFQKSFSNTQYVEFSIYIDRSAPEYSDESISHEIINDSEESMEISAYWTDNRALGFYYYESNITGDFVNSTSKDFNEGWSNETIAVTNPEFEGRSVYCRFYGFDRARNMNQTEYKAFSILSEKPQYFNVSQSSNTVAQYENITFSSYWTDNFNVKNATLKTNITDWIEQTIDINAKYSWANFTFNATDLLGAFEWTIMAYDSINNYNETEPMIFTIE